MCQMILESVTMWGESKMCSCSVCSGSRRLDGCIEYVQEFAYIEVLFRAFEPEVRSEL